MGKVYTAQYPQDAAATKEGICHRKQPKTGRGSSTLAAAPYPSSGTYSQAAAPFTTGHSTLAAASGTFSAQRNQQIERMQPPDQATTEKEGTQPKPFTKQDCNQAPAD
jgi:hypothetical protein